MRAQSQPAARSIKRDLWILSRDWLLSFDRAAWWRFFLALFTLTFAFFLALLSAALNQSGHNALGPACALLSLVLAAIISVKVVPFLARRTAFERWVVKFKYEFTREGAVYLMMIAVMSVAALNTGNNLLFIILASLLAGILVSGILSKIVLSDLELDFLLPEHLFAGQPMICRLTLRNLKWFFPSFSVTVAAQEPDPKKRHPTPRGTSRQILDNPVYLPFIPRRASVTQHVQLTFPLRGRYAQEGFRVSSKFPFGFLKKIRDVAARQEILVLPSVEPSSHILQILPLVSGEVESFLKGRGHDLYGIRDYQDSDSARHVDWKASARAQQLKVREFTREDDRRVMLIFDERVLDSSPQTLRQFEKAVDLCACLAWHFSETEAQMQYLSGGFKTVLALGREVVYPALEALALIKPRFVGENGGAHNMPLAPPTSANTGGFHVIISCQPSGSLTTLPGGASHVIYMESL